MTGATYKRTLCYCVERQKVIRKINQTKKQLAADAKSASNKRKAEASLSELRVDLNYILVRSLASTPLTLILQLY